MIDSNDYLILNSTVGKEKGKNWRKNLTCPKAIWNKTNT